MSHPFLFRDSVYRPKGLLGIVPIINISLDSLYRGDCIFINRESIYRTEYVKTQTLPLHKSTVKGIDSYVCKNYSCVSKGLENSVVGGRRQGVE